MRQERHTSSLNMRYLYRYLSRYLNALFVEKSSNWTSKSGNTSDMACMNSSMNSSILTGRMRRRLNRLGGLTYLLTRRSETAHANVEWVLEVTLGIGSEIETDGDLETAR